MPYEGTMESRSTRANRDEWRKRVERWRDSGLSAEEFATELGIKATTLKFWKYVFAKEGGGETPSARRIVRRKVTRAPFVELQPAVRGDAVFELELGGTRRLRIPSNFDVDALRRLLEALDGAP